MTLVTFRESARSCARCRNLGLIYKHDDGRWAYGPQPSSDNAFTKRMRFHQSWYRATVLKVPYGTGPTPRSKTEYGNMLTAEDAEKGLNFLTPEIFEAVKTRLAEAEGLIEEFRLMRNMLSSQPLCFNLFGYLGLHLDLATQLMDALFPGEVKRVTRVVVEHAPEPRADYLNDHTAFDAFVEYVTVDDQPAFLGIETKLTEPFSPKVYDTAEYRRWMTGSNSPWRDGAIRHLPEIRHNQLWRDHLLAVATLDHPASPYSLGRLMLLRHPGDTKCADASRTYQNLLRPGDGTFVDMPLNRLMDWVDTLDLVDGHKEWLEAFRLRYLDLADSQEAFEAWAEQ